MQHSQRILGKARKSEIVRDLAGKLVNGYNTFNTVCVNGDGKQLHLSDITVYSNDDKAYYVKQDELDKLVKKQVVSVKKKEKANSANERRLLQLLEENEIVNLGRTTRDQLRAVSEQFKTANPEIEVWHVLDRQFDSAPLFEFITQHLNDKCVIRLKISRNSNEKNVAENGKAYAAKLKDVPLNGKQVVIHWVPYASRQRCINRPSVLLNGER